MGKITLLKEDVINKIAAGEVIERPASVVKELVENSLDAKASIISVTIKNSGKDLIKVSDNGEGMDGEDAKKAVVRHATSKICDSEDLFSIETLGFRGEALATIAAVSQMSIITKQQDTLEGINVAISGGDVLSSDSIAAVTGTTIEVQNLFFNTPARKKFLKTDPVELKHIVDIVLQYALINPEVHFSLIHDGHTLLNSPAVENMRDNIASLYGVSLAKELLEVAYEDDVAKIEGFIAKPSDSRNDKNQQTVYVNGRSIKNDTINKAIYDAYHSTLFVNTHPVIVLNVAIDPFRIDVNVHPNKNQIKIEQKEEVYKAVYDAILFTLEKNNLIPIADPQTEEQLTFGSPKPRKIVQDVKYNFEPTDQTVFQVKESLAKVGVHIEPKNYTRQESSDYEESGDNEEQNIQTTFPTMKILGQVHKTFFVAETFGGLYYIDQHAAHERVLYEKFMSQHMETNVAVQQLLEAELIEFSPSEKITINQNMDSLKSFGFTLEPFGGNTFSLKTIPMLFGKTQPKEIIYEVISMLQSGREKLKERKEEIVTRMACRGAVMAGEVLTNGQIEEILSDLSETRLPYTCPHGRPTILKVPVEELEKKFKRI